jgi:hypothetical protein
MDASAPPSQQARYIRRLEIFRDRLLQVDWRNRSILLKRLAARWSFDVVSSAPDGAKAAEGAVEQALAATGQVRLVGDADATPKAETARKALTQQERVARLVFDETGLEHTYLGFPFLVGHIDDEHFVRAPLALFPVRLERKRGARGFGWYLTLQEDAAPVLNKALIAAVKLTSGLSLPPDFQDTLEGLAESAAGAPQSRPLAFLALLEQALVAAEFPLERRGEAPVPFVAIAELTAPEVAALPRSPLRLEANAVVGSFPQGSTAIYRDYEEMIKRVFGGESDQGIVDDLLEAPAELAPAAAPAARSLDLVPDRELNFALDSDGSQDAVIVEAQSAPCVVVRGPPGTGKSQVIVNLISNALAKGERVLLVCQKRAALDVVFQRLQKVGLDDWVVVLHDSHADRKDAYQRLAKLMARKPPALDAALDARFDAATKSIDSAVAELNDIVHPLWESYFGGVRLQELYLTAEPGYRARLEMELSAQDFDVNTVEALLTAMPGLEAGWRRFDAQGAPLAGRKSFAQMRAADQPGLEKVLVDFSKAADDGAMALPTQDAHLALLNETRRFLAKKASFRRFFDFKYPAARRRVQAFIGSHATDPRAKDAQSLKVSLEAGVWLMEGWENLSPLLTQQGKDKIRDSLALPAEARETASRMQRELANFDAIQEHDKAKEALAPPARALFEACARGLGTSSGAWAPIARQEVVVRWIAAVEAVKPQLSGDPYRRYSETRARLQAALDERRKLLIMKLNRDLSRKALTPVMPPGEAHPNKRPDTEWNKLAYEFGKQRRVKPVRKLLEEFPNEFFQVAPCWLTSPEAASDIFPLARGLFDLVVFDESSQLAVERAAPSVYRGKRVLIAGDEKQLRPFDLFQLTSDEGDEDEETEEDETVNAESLLMLAMRTFQPRYLSWHYRSRYQELIDFSNHAFYEGNLQVMANVERKAKVPPIEFVRGQGTWADRKNLPEAVQVVDIAAQLLWDGQKHGTLPSLGVITFNDAQRDAILDEIDRRRKADGAFDALLSKADSPDRQLDERPFVKNIENVQGDERDIILFSVGYAPDAKGKVHVQFGSLNAEGGENRLNVAITRARERVVLVASFDPESLVVDDTKNPGPKLLKAYLLYAKAISLQRREEVEALLKALDPGLAAPRAPSPTLSGTRPLEDQLREALGAAGLSADEHVGFSGYRLDLAVIDPANPDRFALGVECDGAAFQSAVSSRERDVARPRMLQNRGWRLDGVWSRNWWRDRQGEVERIKARANSVSPPAAGNRAP